MEVVRSMWHQVMHNAPNPWKPIQDGLFLGAASSIPAFLPSDPLDMLEVPPTASSPFLLPSPPLSSSSPPPLPCSSRRARWRTCR